MTTFWLGVVHRSHVITGVREGIAQTNHGAKGGIARMLPGDGLVYYSPKTDYPEGDPLREFTAIGRIADAEPWQHVAGDTVLWRRSVNYDRDATHAPITPLLQELDFTRDNRNWGFQLRRGQIEISPHDFAVIARAMGSATVLA